MHSGILPLAPCLFHKGAKDNHDSRGKGNQSIAGDHHIISQSFFSVLTFLPAGHHTSAKAVTGEEVICYFSQSLGGNWDGFLFIHSFFIMSESPVLLLRRDVLCCLNTVIFMHQVRQAAFCGDTNKS